MPTPSTSTATTPMAKVGNIFVVSNLEGFETAQLSESPLERSLLSVTKLKAKRGSIVVSICCPSYSDMAVVFH